MSNVNRRRFINFSIKKRMQARLLIGLMLVVLISVGLTSAFFYFFSSHEVGETYKQFHVNAKNFLEFLLPGVIIAFMIGLVSAIAVGVFIPHRIAGPLYRIERDIKDKVGEGNFKAKFSVRNGDEVGELAEALNIMVEKLRLKVERVKAASGEVARTSKQNEGNKEARRAAEKLEEAVKEFTV